MKTRILSVVGILVVVVLLFSYGATKTKQAESVDPDMLRTQAVSTYVSSMTQTLAVIPTTSPTLTAEPSATLPDVTATLGTPEKADPCYNLIWLKDVTIPDGTHLKANEAFTKTWLVLNNGGCSFPPGFTFSHVGGDLMQGKTVTLNKPFLVGAKLEMSVQLVAPSGVNGLVQSSWRMADANGHYFGDTLSVNILIGDATTPAVTNTP